MTKTCFFWLVPFMLQFYQVDMHSLCFLCIADYQKKKKNAFFVLLLTINSRIGLTGDIITTQSRLTNKNPI